MSRSTQVTISCDGEKCSHIRQKDTNHWLVGGHIQDMLVITSDPTKLKYINEEGETIAFTGTDAVKDFCGEECAIKWISKMLTEIKK